MNLSDKYSVLIDLAKKHNLSVNEKSGVLKITGEVPNGDIKDEMWRIYNQLDPSFKSSDLVLNVEVKSREGDKVRVVTQSGNLNIRKTPGTDEEIVAKAAHGETLTLLNKVNDQWWFIRTQAGVEGYCYAQYLEAIK